MARAEQELGVEIADAQIEALEQHREEIDFARIAELEASLRHDVMAHVRHYGEVAGKDAEKIIHLGATSCFVADNAELVMIRDGLELVMDRLFTVLRQLARFARTHRDLPTLSYTHYQPAQLTTVGKRACLWAQDFALDLESLASLRERLPFRGTKGTTGTQASYLALFDGDHAKVRQLDRKLADAMEFTTLAAVTGQTYPRKVDTWIVSTLADLCSSAAKMASDLRLLAHEREVDEPFGDKQVGSSAMAYKRNPMRSERVCSLARFVHSLATSPPATHANQWLERTLDDSANRRLVITEAFLATDAVLNLCADITAGLVVHPAVVRAHVDAELPFMATENVLMAAVRAGGNRQVLHERIREHSLAAAQRIKAEGRAQRSARADVRRPRARAASRRCDGLRGLRRTSAAAGGGVPRGDPRAAARAAPAPRRAVRVAGQGLTRVTAGAAAAPGRRRGTGTRTRRARGARGPHADRSVARRTSRRTAARARTSGSGARWGRASTLPRALVNVLLSTGLGADTLKAPRASSSSMRWVTAAAASSMWIHAIYCSPLPRRPPTPSLKAGSILARAPPSGDSTMPNRALTSRTPRASAASACSSQTAHTCARKSSPAPASSVTTVSPQAP